METQGIAQTLIIPSVSVRETYDSNVFWAPKSFLQPGFVPEDFETTVTPQLNLAHTGSLISGNLSVGAIIARYVNNPVLDYTGINSAGSLNLSRVAQRMSRRITTFSVTGAYQFTPSMSGFQAAGGGTGMGYGTTGISALGAGLVTNRVSMHSTQIGVNGGYQLNPTTSVSANYQYLRLSFSGQFGGVGTPLFDLSGHTATTTLNKQLNPRDTVGVAANFANYDFGETSFRTIAATANWSRNWTQKVSTSLSGGGLVVPPMDTSVPGQTIKGVVVPTATARVSYTSVLEELRGVGATPGPFDNLPRLAGSLTPGSLMPAGRYTAALVYTYSVYPSFAYGVGPIKTHVVGANLEAGLTSKMTGRLGTNAAHGSLAGLQDFNFTTVGGSAGLSYLLGPVLADLSYNYLNFSSESSSVGVGPTLFAFSKHMVMLSLSTAFNSQAFFRMGGFQTVETQQPVEGSSGPSGAPGSGPGSLRKE